MIRQGKGSADSNLPLPAVVETGNQDLVSKNQAERHFIFHCASFPLDARSFFLLGAKRALIHTGAPAEVSAGCTIGSGDESGCDVPLWSAVVHPEDTHPSRRPDRGAFMAIAEIAHRRHAGDFTRLFRDERNFRSGSEDLSGSEKTPEIGTDRDIRPHKARHSDERHHSDVCAINGPRMSSLTQEFNTQVDQLVPESAQRRASRPFFCLDSLTSLTILWLESPYPGRKKGGGSLPRPFKSFRKHPDQIATGLPVAADS